MKRTRNLTFLLLGVASIIMTGCQKKMDVKISVDKTEIKVNESVKFTNTTTNADSYEWDFGDGEISLEQSPSHSWSSAGTYEVKMTACPKQTHGPQQHFGGNKCNDSIISIKVNN